MKLPRIARAVAVLAVFTLLPVPQARAALEGSFTESEKVGFAFYQLGHLVPHFESWVTSIPAYRKMEPQLRPDFAASNAKRLRDGYLHFNPAVDLIHVRVSGRMLFPNFESRTEAFMQNKPITARLEINDFAQRIFPYKIGENWIALAPKGIDGALKFALTEDEQRSLFRKMQVPEGTKMRQVDVEFLLQPVEADTEMPQTLKGLKVWMMSAKIASVSVWKRGGEFIWPVYTAPWYRADTKDEIMDLYR
jgi:hypothetical protein